jgi:hypothetical protein
MYVYQMWDSQLFIYSFSPTPDAIARRHSPPLYVPLCMLQLLLAWKVPKGEEHPGIAEPESW